MSSQMKTMKLALLAIIFLVEKSQAQDICDDLSQNANTVSTECKAQLLKACKNGTILWQMFDASSKYPTSGMSYSSNKDLGNFDQCIDIDHRDGEDSIKGKYCGLNVALVNLFHDPIPNPYKMDIESRTLKPLASLPQISYKSDFQLRDIFNDYSISLLSMCVPDKCTPSEVGHFFIWGNLADSNTTILYFQNDVPCITKDSNTDFQGGDIAFIFFLSMIGACIILSTAYDYYIQLTNSKARHPLFLAFSFLTNGKKLLHISHTTNPDQIQCLNGMRFISMMWVIAGHNFVMMESVPLSNYKEVRGFMDNPKSQYIGAAPIAVDTFFFLSGFLLTYGYLKSSVRVPVKGQIFRIPIMVLHRYLRLTPALAVVFFSLITIFRMLGTGPLWGAVTQLLQQPCEKYWWSFFLYIQNYVNYDNFCLTQTWYLSADMQMFILAPVVLIPLTVIIKNNKPDRAIIGLLVLIVICVFFPIGIRFADKTIDNVYDTHSRLNDYLIGVLLGVIMRDPRFEKFPFKRLTNLTIWCVVLNICVAFNLYYHVIIRVYEHTSDTLFYGLYRPVWCFSLAWMVYSCYHGFGGPINSFLSMPVFQIGARISYCMYLLHAPVQMYFIGLVRTQYYWGDYVVFYLWCGHFVVTMLLSTFWSLAFESPMITIEKFILPTGKKSK